MKRHDIHKRAAILLTKIVYELQEEASPGAVVGALQEEL